MKGQNKLLSSNCDEWETPQNLFNYLNEKFKFTLDPCSTLKNAKCKGCITKEGLFDRDRKILMQRGNGLTLNWNLSSNSIFCNPPYSTIKLWVKKCYEESKKGSIVVMLIPARVDTTYWHDFIFPFAREIIFIRGRLKFNDHKNPSTFPSAIIIFKKRKRKYLKISTISNKMKGSKKVKK